MKRLIRFHGCKGLVVRERAGKRRIGCAEAVEKSGVMAKGRKAAVRWSAAKQNPALKMIKASRTGVQLIPRASTTSAIRPPSARVPSIIHRCHSANAWVLADC